jgi:hypothetical protein
MGSVVVLFEPVESCPYWSPFERLSRLVLNVLELSLIFLEHKMQLLPLNNSYLQIAEQRKPDG